MSAYLDRPRRSYRQALTDRCAQAVKRGAQDHKAKRELARINARQVANALYEIRWRRWLLNQEAKI